MKLDDSYLNGCYLIDTGSTPDLQGKQQIVNRITAEMLRYMKNEIYADYAYKFKDPRWQEVFEDMPSYYDNKSGNPKANVSVDDSLTDIDKYNIEWINRKLKSLKLGTTLAEK
ncbi:MAG TPA: YARHG domain-containing protein, partial [Mucilaginibacter sp.]|nr:YARHG domain-containing protein [Mucilaginibacter sp.]